MEGALYGPRPDSAAGDRPVRRLPGSDDVSFSEDFDAALHLLEKRLRLREWQLSLVLEGLEALNATLKGAER